MDKMRRGIPTHQLPRTLRHDKDCVTLMAQLNHSFISTLGES